MSIFDLISDSIHDLLGGTMSTDLADLGADPDQVVPGAMSTDVPAMQFPDSTGSAAMNQVNLAMETATDNYQAGMEIADTAPTMPSAGQQAQSIIDGVMQASPEQLDAMEDTVGGLNASDEIHASVGESEQALADRNAAHEAVIAADRAEIHAESVAAGAEAEMDRAQSVL